MTDRYLYRGADVRAACCCAADMEKLLCFLCRALDTAFQDLSALMRQAQDMVAIAERFRATTRSQH